MALFVDDKAQNLYIQSLYTPEFDFKKITPTVRMAFESLATVGLDYLRTTPIKCFSAGRKSASFINPYLRDEYPRCLTPRRSQLKEREGGQGGCSSIRGWACRLDQNPQNVNYPGEIRCMECGLKCRKSSCFPGGVIAEANLYIDILNI